jgi:hypothetical protein
MMPSCGDVSRENAGMTIIARHRGLFLFNQKAVSMYSAKNYSIQLFIFLLSVTLMACGTEDYRAYADWDVNDDNFIDEEEFVDAFIASDYVADWDMDGDDMITYGELYGVYYHIWDVDDDNALSQSEWSNAVNTYLTEYNETIYGDFNDWDINQDEIITKNEYMEAVLDTDFFNSWDLDSDATISEEEFARGVYEYWDTDGDGMIEAVEYEEWNEVYSGI